MFRRLAVRHNTPREVVPTKMRLYSELTGSSLSKNKRQRQQGHKRPQTQHR